MEVKVRTIDMRWRVQQSRMVWSIFWLCGRTGVSDAVRDTCEVQWAARDWGLVHAVLCNRRSRWPNTRFPHQFYLLRRLSG